MKQSRMITKLQKTSFQSMGCGAKSSQGKQKYRQRPIFLSCFCTRFPDQFATGFIERGLKMSPISSDGPRLGFLEVCFHSII